MTGRLSEAVRSALRETGLPWSIEQGGRHHKLRLDGKLVGVLNLNSHGAHVVAERNLIAQIRRAARGREGGRA